MELLELYKNGVITLAQYEKEIIEVAQQPKQ